MSSTAVQAPQAAAPAAMHKLDDVRSLIRKLGPRFDESLARNLDKNLVMSIAVTAIRSNPQLLECTTTSLVACIIQSNQLGLRLDGPLGHAYMVPYRSKKKQRTEAQLAIGYRGYLELARRSGEIVGVSAGVVRERDFFECEHGIDERLVHKPALSGDRGKLTHVYAWAKLKSGAFLFDVMQREEIEHARKRSRAKDDGPWATDYEEMARKTVIRRLSKYLPLSAEASQGVAADDRATRGIPTTFKVDASTGEILEEVDYEDQEPEEVEGKATDPPAASTPRVAQGGEPGALPPAAAREQPEEIGATRTRGISELIGAAKDLARLSKIPAAIASAYSCGEITEKQRTDLNQAYEAARSQLAPAAGAKQ